MDVIGALRVDDPVRMLGDLARFLGGDETSYTGDLLRLIAKADPANTRRLMQSHSREVRAYHLWMRMGRMLGRPPRAAELLAELDPPAEQFPREDMLTLIAQAEQRVDRLIGRYREFAAGGDHNLALGELAALLGNEPAGGVRRVDGGIQSFDPLRLTVADLLAIAVRRLAAAT